MRALRAANEVEVFGSGAEVGYCCARSLSISSGNFPGSDAVVALIAEFCWYRG